MICQKGKCFKSIIAQMIPDSYRKNRVFMKGALTKENEGKCRLAKQQAEQVPCRNALQTKDFVYNERKSHCMRKIQGKDLCQKADIEQE